jgi:imidazolonepropionase-like amidohydrolase
MLADCAGAAVIRILTALAIMLAGPALHAQGELRIRSGRARRNRTAACERHDRVSGSRIVDIDSSGSTPADIDLGQSTLLPGLIDVHSHIGWHFGPNGRYEPRAATPAQDALYAAENAFVTPDGWFTTIRSPRTTGDVDLRDAIARAVLPGRALRRRSCEIVPTSGTPDELRQTVRAETPARRRRVRSSTPWVDVTEVEQAMSGEQWQALW